ncbi:MAG TPA: hypothetical protein DCL88_05820 [Gammaproteobacteria bacterium]|nr:hypothetical protein [Gammaproteobacteria bacterium]
MQYLIEQRFDTKTILLLLAFIQRHIPCSDRFTPHLLTMPKIGAVRGIIGTIPLAQYIQEQK